MPEIVEWAEAAIGEMQEPVAGFGMFTVSFDNRKKQGYGGRHYKRYEAWGTLYPSGHVHLDTDRLRVRDFERMQQMRDELGLFGSFEIRWQVGGEV